MIKSFKHKGLKEFYLTGSIKGIQAMHQEKLRMVLSRLSSLDEINDVNIPSFRLHKLKGDMKNLWSITIQANWRLTFEFKNKNVYILDYQDYH